MPTLKDKETYDRHELFHAYIVDSTGTYVDKSLYTNFEKNPDRICLFTSDMDDKKRTNMRWCGFFGDDLSFVIDSIRISAKFSNALRFPDFIRTTRFHFCIVDKPYHSIEANVLADPGLRQEVETDSGIEMMALSPIKPSIAIMPRQSFNTYLETHPIFSKQLIAIERGELKEYAEIKIGLCGDLRTRYQWEDYRPIKQTPPEIKALFESSKDKG